MEAWEQELREKLANNTTTEVLERPKKYYKINKPLIIFVLLCVNLYIYNHETQGAWITYFQSRLNPAPLVVPQPKQPDYSPQFSRLKSDISKIASENRENKKEIDKLKESWVKESRKTTLLGILHNENFQIIASKQNPKDIIFLNRDWTINKLPSHLQLTPDDVEFLNKFYKKHVEIIEQDIVLPNISQ